MKHARWLCWFLGAFLAGGASVFFGQEFFAAPKDKMKNEAKGQQPATVAALGRLEPESEVIDIGAPAGSRLESLAVKEGAYVEKNAVLAQLDSQAEMKAARDVARSQWVEAQKRRAAETAVGILLIEEAGLAIKQVEEVALLAIEAQNAETRRSLAELDKARLDINRAKQMLTDEAIPRSQYDGAILTLRQAEEQCDRNKFTLAQLKKDRDLKLLLTRAKMNSAQAALTRAQLGAQVDSLAENLKLAEARLERTVIRAPLAGAILKILTRAGESIDKKPILKMGNTKAMYAVAEVYETDVRQVQPGQRATITSKAFPDLKIAGSVERIGAIIHKNDVLRLDPTAAVDARIIEVRIRLDDSTVAARYNHLQVEVFIEAATP